MLEDAAGIRRVVLACGTVDLKKGIDGLATIIGDKYKQNPFEKGTPSGARYRSCIFLRLSRANGLIKSYEMSIIILGTIMDIRGCLLCQLRLQN